ncbi:unnamed protein product, partial [Porites evermanni]
MKPDLGKTWYKVRWLGRWFNQWRLSSETEKDQPKQVQSITDPANFVCEMMLFEFKKPGCNPEIKKAENGRLTWNNAIPDQEVHLKPGGDAVEAKSKYFSSLVTRSSYERYFKLLEPQDPRHWQIEKRNMKNIEEDYNKFVADGCVTSRQKCYHNMIHEKLLDIELESLGVFKRLFDEIENQSAELDKIIEMELAADSDNNDERILALRAAHQHSSVQGCLLSWLTD